MKIKRTICIALLAMPLTVGALEAATEAEDLPTAALSKRQLEALVAEQQTIIEQQRHAIAEKNKLIDSVNAEMIRALDTLERSVHSNQSLQEETRETKRLLRQVEADRDRYRSAMEELERESERFQTIARDFQSANDTLRQQLVSQPKQDAQTIERDRFGRAIVRP